MNAGLCCKVKHLNIQFTGNFVGIVLDSKGSE